MLKASHLIAALGLSTFVLFAHAQSAADITQRNVNQETRIRNGLQDGSLTTREAAVLEKREGQADRMQANALKDGKLTDAERARITAAENRNSRAIANVTNAISKQDGDVSNLRIVNRQADFFEMIIDVEVRDLRQLINVIASLRAANGVHQVERAKG